MALVVMKFGGTSVANVERIRNVGRHVKREIDAGNKVAVVVSAMAGATNQLVAWVREASLLHDAREYDAVVAWRAGHRRPARDRAAVDRHPGPLLAGLAGSDPHEQCARGGPHPRHQGRGDRQARRRRRGRGRHRLPGARASKNLATLGRGGSDERRCLAVALSADVCDIYTDVDGVYTTDPRIVPRARRLPRVSYEEMLEMASLGSKSCRRAPSSSPWSMACACASCPASWRPRPCPRPHGSARQRRHHRLR